MLLATGLGLGLQVCRFDSNDGRHRQGSAEGRNRTAASHRATPAAVGDDPIERGS
jgi:hypothetical protein